MEDKRFYVYLHFRKTDGSVFYVGRGCRNRANSSYRRSKYWRNIVNKNGLGVIKLVENITSEEANRLESEIIKFYGRIDLQTGILINMTDGGDGVIGYRHSEEFKNKKRLDMLGNKHSVDNKTWVGKKHSQESKNKMSLNNPKINSKIVMDTEYGIFYNSVREAAELLGYKKATLASYLNGNLKNKTNLIYV
jgi:hypothetical protein